MCDVRDHSHVVLVEGDFTEWRKRTHEESHLVDSKHLWSRSYSSCTSFNDTDTVNTEDVVGGVDLGEESCYVEGRRGLHVREGSEIDPILHIFLSRIQSNDSRTRIESLHGEEGHSVDLVASRVNQATKGNVDKLLK